MTLSNPAISGLSTFVPDSPAAWRRLFIALAIGAVGSVGMWSVVVALPKVQAEFGVSRGAASLAYTLAMMGFGIGGVIPAAWWTGSASCLRSAWDPLLLLRLSSAPVRQRRYGSSRWCILSLGSARPQPLRL